MNTFEKFTELSGACLHNLNTLRQYNEEFRNIFKVPLKKFWINNLVGFDIVAFDEFLETPQNYSMRQIIEEKYGERAVYVILRLIGVPDECGNIN